MSSLPAAGRQAVDDTESLRNRIAALERAADEELHRSRARLRWVLEKTELGTWMNALPLGNLSWDEQTRRLYYVQPEVQPTAELFWSRLHPDDREPTRLAIEAAIRDRAMFAIDHRAVSPNTGELRWIRSVGQAAYAHDGTPTHFDGINYDITARKRDEEALQRTTRRYALLSETAGALLATPDPQKLVNDLCLKVMHHLECDVFFNFLADASTGRLQLNACAGIPDAEMAKIQWLDYGTAVCGCVARDHRRIVAEDIQNTPDERTHLVNSYGVRAYCCHPLMAGDRCIGTISFGTRRRAHFAADEIELMRVVADQVAMAMERIRSEAALRQSDERHRLLAETMLQGVVHQDSDGKIISMNPAAERILGKAPARFLGSSSAGQEKYTIRENGMPFPGQEHPAMVALRVGVPVRNVIMGVFNPIENGYRWISIDAVPLFRPGEAKPYEVYTVFSDVTERREAEAEQQALIEERGRLLESERSARSEAERANRLKDVFLANLSHELRTPLTAILGWTQLLRRGHGNADTAAKGLEVIERNTRIQVQLVSDLLDMSSIISGKLRLQTQNCDPVAPLEAAVDALAPAAEAKRIRIEKRIEQVPGLILGDPSRLQQAFWNLLSNAIKFTPAGGCVQIVLRQTDSRISIVFRDTGKGFSPDLLPHLFERFRQGDSSTAKNHGGLGLGLAIVKHLVELHGGSVRAESPGEGRGAAFTVTLPILGSSDEHNARTDRVTPEDLGVGNITLNGVKVLFVDDEPDTREMIRRLLEERGASVVLADSAARGVALLQEFRPDVLVADIGMPGEDGYRMIRRIRELPPEAGGATAAVALTAYSRMEDRTRAMLAGFQYHLAKPVECAELMATLGVITQRLPKRPAQSIE